MDKKTELEILAVAVKSLGADSYCGAWLSGVMAEVESAMRSDFVPAATIAGTAARCREIEAQAIEAANFTLDKANAQAAAIIAEARNDAEGIRCRIAATLRECDRLINR